jgi:shikimate kinase
MEVYDGYSWIQLTSTIASVGLTAEVETLITWARKKRNEELMLEAKAKDNPAIADLLNQRNTIDEQIKVIEILTKDNKVGTN